MLGTLGAVREGREGRPPDSADVVLRGVKLGLLSDVDRPEFDGVVLRGVNVGLLSVDEPLPPLLREKNPPVPAPPFSPSLVVGGSGLVTGSGLSLACGVGSLVGSGLSTGGFGLIHGGLGLGFVTTGGVG